MMSYESNLESDVRFEIELNHEASQVPSSYTSDSRCCVQIDCNYNTKCVRWYCSIKYTVYLLTYLYMYTETRDSDAVSQIHNHKSMHPSCYVYHATGDNVRQRCNVFTVATISFTSQVMHTAVLHRPQTQPQTSLTTHCDAMV